MEARDDRRAVILADVLEKTARAYQRQIYTQPMTESATPPTTSRISSKELRYVHVHCINCTCNQNKTKSK